MSRQPTLGKFGFKKSIEHRGSKSTVQLPDFMAKKAKTFECSVCCKAFINQQGLSVHEKCVHGVTVKGEMMAESSRPTTASRIETESEIKEAVRSTMDKILSLVAEESSNSELGN